jgi:hypothetical protein
MENSHSNRNKKSYFALMVDDVPQTQNQRSGITDSNITIPLRITANGTQQVGIGCKTATKNTLHVNARVLTFLRLQ